ncbi:MAG: hypothetical protein QG577_923, partial [Thermodesulfobacteriota bacterium]|nr:hypothetical protein [Thermodesulfobacteriota bacterium]
KAGFRSSSSFSKSSGTSYNKGSSWSQRTHDTWDRHGGGFFGGQSSSGGYTKPVPNTQGKPPQAPAEKATERAPSGYAKPSLDSSVQSGGYTKPKFPQGNVRGESTPAPRDSSSGYSKPSPVSSGTQTFQGGSKFDKQTIKTEGKKASQESLEKYKSAQSAFPKTGSQAEGMLSGPLADKARHSSGVDPGTHRNRMDDYYRNQGYRPPAHMVGSSPSFGIFNSLFLFWMLDHITNKNVAATAYNHSNDPGFQKWRQEVETLAKDNEELRGKLSEMDRQIKSMEGTPKDPSYLPPGVPVEAALAPTVFGATHSGGKPVLRLATGQPGGWYNKFATLFEKQSEGFEVRVIPTSGSLDNMKLLSSGAADMALVQSDVLALRDSAPGSAPVVTEQATLFKEYVQLLANRSSGLKSLTDLDPKRHEVYVGPKDSGTAMTWSMLCKVNPSLARIKTKHTDYKDALSRVQTNPNSLMLFVGGLNSDFLKQAEEAAAKKDRLRLIPIDDSRFTDILDSHGNRIYQMTTIRADVYPHLQKGWFFGHDVKTLAVQAVLVLRNDWAARFGTEAMDGLSAAIVEIRPTLERIVNGAG